MNMHTKAYCSRDLNIAFIFSNGPYALPAANSLRASSIILRVRALGMSGAENSILCSDTKLRRKPLTTVPSGSPTRAAVSSAAFLRVLSVLTVSNVFVFVVIYQSIYLGINLSTKRKPQRTLIGAPAGEDAAG